MNRLKYSFPIQRTAIEEAGKIIRVLPEDTRFSLTVTEADRYDDPSVLNIFVPKGEISVILVFVALVVDIHKTATRGATFVSYRHESLMVSIIEDE